MVGVGVGTTSSVCRLGRERAQIINIISKVNNITTPITIFFRLLSGRCAFVSDDTDATTGSVYRTDHNNLDELRVLEIGVGTVIGPVSLSDEEWHRMDITRRYDGVFELFTDHVFRGTGTESFLAVGATLNNCHLERSLGQFMVPL